MAKFKALSRGSQIVLVAGPLLFLSLFLTWQNVEVDYGTAGMATASLDGWDAWGLLLALLVASTVTIVALLNFTEDVMSADIHWPKVTFALGVAILGVALLKNLTDADSSWASYGFVALAGAVALGTYRDWAADRQGAKPALGQKRRGLRSAA
jgi:heme/copper-type cytochrome/quinol oxidase subunit 3